MEPRGIRNCNPLNIIRSRSKWVGMRREQTDRRFVQFTEMKYGWRAALVLLTRTYYVKWKLDTVRKIITRWAPPSDGNHTERYVATVARRMQRGADDVLPKPWEQPEAWQDLAWCMAQVENGNYPMQPEPLLDAWAMM